MHQAAGLARPERKAGLTIGQGRGGRVNGMAAGLRSEGGKAIGMDAEPGGRADWSAAAARRRQHGAAQQRCGAQL